MKDLWKLCEFKILSVKYLCSKNKTQKYRICISFVIYVFNPYEKINIIDIIT